MVAHIHTRAASQLFPNYMGIGREGPEKLWSFGAEENNCVDVGQRRKMPGAAVVGDENIAKGIKC